MAPSVVPILLILLAAAAAAAPGGGWNGRGRGRGRWNAPPPLDRKTLEWMEIVKTWNQFSTNRDRYLTLATALSSFARGQSSIKQHPVLFKQPKGYHAAPPTLRSVNVEGDGKDRARIHIRGDNLYIACVTNGIGEVFCFNDNQHNSYTMPNAKILPFGADYKDLVGEERDGAAWKNLIGLDLSKAAINRAVKVISNHRITKTSEADINALKHAMATMAVFMCESTRFPYIRQLVARAYTGDGEAEENTLDSLGARLVVNWKNLSCAILIWLIDGKTWDGSDEAKALKALGINNIEEALATVGPILQSTTCTKAWYTHYNL